jgi:effector-binding domain-containing protein
MIKTIYFYFSTNGIEMCTPNRELAFARAAIHSTNEVYSLDITENV